jgi:hypothetical protein
LLVQGQTVTVNGAQGMGLTRLGLGVQFRPIPVLALFVSPALANSPKKDSHYYAAISRLELVAGAAYRF